MVASQALGTKTNQPQAEWGVFSSKLLLQIGVAAELLLSMQLAAPLDGTPTLPAELNWLLVALVFTATALYARKSPGDRRWISIYCLISLIGIALTAQPGQVASAPILASRLGASLSQSIYGIAWLGVLHAWAALGWGWLCSDILSTLSENHKSLPLRLCCWGLGAMVAGFGLRAVIGYATGSTALFFTP